MANYFSTVQIDCSTNHYNSYFRFQSLTPFLGKDGPINRQYVFWGIMRGMQIDLYNFIIFAFCCEGNGMYLGFSPTGSKVNWLPLGTLT